MTTPILAVEELRYSYPGGRHALDGVGFTLSGRERLGILGPNGAGKSTLLLHLNGSLRGAGRITVDGIELGAKTLPEIRRRVGMVFQDPDDQLFMNRVGDDVAFGPLNFGVPGDEIPGRVAAALEQVGMAGTECRSPHQLSVGEKKRVAIATVLAMDCGLLVLDEPTASLDPRGRRLILRLLAELEIPMVVATHDMGAAAALCNRILVLDRGKVAACGAAEELLADTDFLEAHGLEAPPGGSLPIPALDTAALGPGN